MIVEKTVYETRGRTFDTEDKAKQYRADLIGQFFDTAPVLMHPGDRIKLNDFIVEHRTELVALLDY